MSQPRGFGLNAGKSYQNVVTPQSVWCNFIVDSANGNGYGTRSVKSNGYVESVFMHTSATPGSLNGYINPNPAVGYCQVRFKNTFNYYLGGFSGQIVPLASTGLTSVTAGSVYVVTSLGTTTLAQWLTVGVPLGALPSPNSTSSGSLGHTPAAQSVTVGTAFVATATGSIGGTGTVGAPGLPTATTLTVIGDPNQVIGNLNVAQNAGAQVLVQFAAPTNSSTTTLVAAAPADGTVVAMQFVFDRSTTTIDGL